jgi:hypothetical protein
MLQEVKQFIYSFVPLFSKNDMNYLSILMCSSYIGEKRFPEKQRAEILQDVYTCKRFLFSNMSTGGAY